MMMLGDRARYAAILVFNILSNYNYASGGVHEILY